MATFQFIAKDSAGQERRGTIDAGDRAGAISAIRAQGLFPTAIGEVKGGGGAPAAAKAAKKPAKAPVAKAPGKKNIDKDSYTLLDAIAAAGDLTIDARRDVTVTRILGDTVMNYVVDLRNERDVYSSPAFYLSQNDVIYAAPTAKKARTSTVNGNTVLSASFWVSIASLIASVLSIALRNVGSH